MKLEKNHLLNATGYTYPLQNFSGDPGSSGIGPGPCCSVLIFSPEVFLLQLFSISLSHFLSLLSLLTLQILCIWRPLFLFYPMPRVQSQRLTQSTCIPSFWNSLDFHLWDPLAKWQLPSDIIPPRSCFCLFMVLLLLIHLDFSSLEPKSFKNRK